MSLSTPTAQNPAQHYFEWKGGEGKIQFYDKEKQVNVAVPLPFEFTVLDQLNGVTGWNDQDQSGIWSNETRSTRDDFTVRTKRGVKYVGPYKNEQGISQVSGFGGKYVKIVYIAHKNRAGELIIGRIGLTGAALNAWIDFTKAHSITSGKVRITGKQEDKKGTTVFQIPVFEWSKWDDGEFDAAVKLDEQLQDYLRQYLTAPKYDDNAEPVNDWDVDDGKATPEEVADFNQRFEKATTKPEPVTAATKRPVDEVFENIDDTPIDLSDIPF